MHLRENAWPLFSYLFDFPIFVRGAYREQSGPVGCKADTEAFRRVEVNAVHLKRMNAHIEKTSQRLGGGRHQTPPPWRPRRIRTCRSCRLVGGTGRG